MAGNTEVVVVGGGYAGVMAANRLTQRDDVTVTVVNPRPTFVARLRLHQLVGGSHPAVVDYREVLADRVRLVVDTVTRVDPAGRRVILADGRPIGYDYLVYAAGSGDTDRRVPGAAEFTHPIATLEAAQRLRSVLDTTPATARLTVVGAGPTGIETAAELAEQGRPVTLVCGGVLGRYLHPRARRTASKRLAALGVTVIEGPDAKVTAVTRESVRLGDGRELPSGVTVWTAGFAVPDLAARSGLRTDAAGRLVTDETLTSVDDERIVAAGDCAAPSNLPLRMSAYVASCLGAHAADTVLHRITGGQPTPVSVLFTAMCVSLGRHSGVYQLARRDDTAMPLYVSGRAGAKLKEIACDFSVKHLVDEARRPGTHTWLRNSHRQRLLRAEQARVATHQ
ncbi:NAD(P)/FAD-dependent oxidoreductase [Micromonospora coxensis]|uniref:NADH dehydrogenase, FAD-containing subunit n=1 Tax=Micromonospora coxensis TaxID=356852 RepID=A0A1C5K1K3_9ACTN|nr:FAD-dependent oxidoreductase [Micromonospora coxensis]SCG76176.1 NADH dehydrogenase, FAD-containing subunit [Micromonospora coxensis]